MSNIAAMLILLAAPVTAEQAAVAHHAATSIGPDPCRGVPKDDEIVVCARVTNPYAVPLYRHDAERYDSPGTAAGGFVAVKEAFAACHARGEVCLKPLPVVTLSSGARGLRIGEE